MIELLHLLPTWVYNFSWIYRGLTFRWNHNKLKVSESKVHVLHLDYQTSWYSNTAHSRGSLSPSWSKAWLEALAYGCCLAWRENCAMCHWQGRGQNWKFEVWFLLSVECFAQYKSYKILRHFKLRTSVLTNVPCRPLELCDCWVCLTSLIDLPAPLCKQSSRISA